VIGSLRSFATFAWSDWPSHRICGRARSDNHDQETSARRIFPTSVPPYPSTRCIPFSVGGGHRFHVARPSTGSQERKAPQIPGFEPVLSLRFPNRRRPPSYDFEAPEEQRNSASLCDSATSETQGAVTQLVENLFKSGAPQTIWRWRDVLWLRLPRRCSYRFLYQMVVRPRIC